MMAKYSHHHPELQSSNFLIPQVPGTIRRSKPIHGVLESVMAAKKYMVPLVVLNPYIGGGLLVEYFGHRRFDPARNALISNLDSGRGLDAPMTRDERLRYQSRMDELSQSRSGLTVEPRKDQEARKPGSDLQASAQPGLDASRATCPADACRRCLGSSGHFARQHLERFRVTGISRRN